MRKTTVTTSLLAFSLSLFAGNALAGPGHNGGDSDLTDADVDRTISIDAGDMWFDPEEIELTAGEVVKFEITNTGSIEHEFVIGDEGAQEAHREMMQEMGGHDMSKMSHDNGHDMSDMSMPSITIAPGETESLLWRVTDDADELEYACNIPGHYESGMYGGFSL